MYFLFVCYSCCLGVMQSYVLFMFFLYLFLVYGLILHILSSFSLNLTKPYKHFLCCAINSEMFISNIIVLLLSDLSALSILSFFLSVFLYILLVFPFGLSGVSVCLVCWSASSVCSSVCMSICLSVLSVCLSSLSVCLSALSVCQLVWLYCMTLWSFWSVFLFCLVVCLPVCWSVCLVYLFNLPALSVCLSFCLFCWSVSSVGLFLLSV